MKNTFGNALTITLFGESHGEMMGACLDGLAPGIVIDEEYINKKLELRRPSGKISTKRVEDDEYKIVSGVFNGKTTGAPLCVLIPNSNTHSSDYADLKDLPRPSHADLTANYKYHGFQDYRGGGHFSGRVTACLVCACAIIQSALEQKGIFVGTHISKINDIVDDNITSVQDVIDLGSKQFPTVSKQVESKMLSYIEQVANVGDSVGGVLETVVFGMPVGVGEPWFDTLEGVISHAIFSIPAIKGVEFGAGFSLANMLGSQANDQFDLDGDEIVTSTNNNGGINGGISNGMPIVFRSVVKPTPSIYKQQSSVRLSTLSKEELAIKGRHDPAIIHRARVVVDALTAFALADLLTVRFGTDYLAK